MYLEFLDLRWLQKFNVVTVKRRNLKTEAKAAVSECTVVLVLLLCRPTWSLIKFYVITCILHFISGELTS